MHGPLYDHLKIDVIGALVGASSSTDNNSSRVDMSGYEGCLFLCTCTVFAAGGVATLTIEGGDTDADPSGHTISGAVATKTDGSGGVYDNGLLVVDCWHPSHRYLQAVRTSSVANVTFGPMIAIRYNGAQKPEVQDSADFLASTSVADA